jgi:hypothetical protein
MELSHSDIIAELLTIKKLLAHNLSRVHAVKDHISPEGYAHDVAHYERKIVAMDAAIEAVGIVPKSRPLFSSLVSTVFHGAQVVSNAR